MDGYLGHAGVLVAFAAAVIGAVTGAAGLLGRRGGAPSGRRYAWLVLAGALVAVAAMEHALVTHNFSIAFVAGNDSYQTPLLYRVTGLWSALAGSILLWAAILAVFLAALVVRFRRRAADPVVGWATVTVFTVAAFFFGLMLGPADPFRAVAGAIPADGAGPNPLLQNNALVAFHPPLLYTGFVGLTIPFAFAVGMLVTGRVEEEWLVETRRWTLLAWGCLTAGIVLGMWWSYQVLGWGGFWAWDPVENASFIPWLTATAFLHSAAVQERRGMLRVWNLSLVMATFSLTILGTFLTRSGLVESVHSFSESTIGPILLGFFGLVVATGIVLIGWRGDRLRAPGSIDSPLSREGAFLLNNLVFAVFAFVVLLGTVFPLLVQAVNGGVVAVGAPYFDRMGVPIVLSLLALMAVAPLLSWRRTSPAVLRSRLLVPAWAGGLTILGCALAGLRGVIPLVAFGLAAAVAASALRQLAILMRRHGAAGLLGRSGGGMVAHVGVALVAAALAGSLSYGQRTEVRLGVGQATRFDGVAVTYLGSRSVSYPNRTAVLALVQVGQGRIGEPAITEFRGDPQGIGTPWVVSGPHEDVYVTLDVAPTAVGGAAVLGLVVQPLVMWLWVGGALIVLGGALAAAPEIRRRRRWDGSSAGWRRATRPVRPDARDEERDEEEVPVLVSVLADLAAARGQ